MAGSLECKILDFVAADSLCFVPPHKEWALKHRLSSYFNQVVNFNLTPIALIYGL
jgi:hypothetical protein